MTSPMLTVIVLAVLWLIVVVPMVLRRNDERAGERSVARFGSAMRALASRRAAPRDPDDALAVLPRSGSSAATLTVPNARPGGYVTTRRPVPAARESLMYPADRQDLSEARRQMLARRRRSLTVLGAGTVLFFLVSLVMGGAAFWTIDLLFVAGLASYVWFLRTQALRDRDRRENRLARAGSVPVRGYDATAEPSFVARPESVVRIDEDDVHLEHLDTVDLTGLYSEADEDEPIRRAG